MLDHTLCTPMGIRNLTVDEVLFYAFKRPDVFEKMFNQAVTAIVSQQFRQIDPIVIGYQQMLVKMNFEQFKAYTINLTKERLKDELAVLETECQIVETKKQICKSHLIFLEHYEN